MIMPVPLAVIMMALAVVLVTTILVLPVVHMAACQ